MNIGFLGSTVMDHLKMQGKERLSPGGIFYSVAAAKSFMKPENSYYLITSFSEQYKTQLDEWFSGFNLEFSDISSVMPEVFLTTFVNREREERYENFIQSSVVKKGIPTLDALYINMITGFDISCNELKELKEKQMPFIYFDVHSLARGVTENFERPFRLIPKVKEWLTSINILQANESELLMLGEGRDVAGTLEFLFQISPDLVLINTLGARGAGIYQKQNNQITVEIIEPFSGSNVNAIGCGDVFGATFFLNYLENNNLLQSAQFAAAAGAAVTKYSSIHQLRELKHDVINRIS